MSMKLINLELFFVNSDIEYSRKQMYDFSLELAKEDIDNSNSTSIAFMLLLDGFVYSNNLDFYNFLVDIQNYAKAKGVIDLYLIVGMASDNSANLKLHTLDYKIINYDFTLVVTAKSYLNNTAEWNYDANKFLFLTGKPSRHNRITLLSKFYRADMLSNAEWSFFKPLTDKEWCRNALSDFTDSEYETFLNDCERKLDSKYYDNRHYTYVNGRQAAETNVFQSKLGNDIVHIDSDVYTTTSFSVVSEGVVNENDYSEYLTEKTYRAIINRHPFILVANSNMYKYLQQEGYKTFSEYFPVPDYFNITDTHQYLDAVVQNTLYFMKNYHLYKDCIQKDINHNHMLLNTKIQQCVDTRKFLINNGADITEVEYFLNHTGPSRLIRIYEVKDENK